MCCPLLAMCNSNCCANCNEHSTLTLHFHQSHICICDSLTQMICISDFSLNKLASLYNSEKLFKGVQFVNIYMVSRIDGHSVEFRSSNF